MIRARRACAILRNLGEVARTYLCLDRERRVREGTCPAKGTGFSNLHSVGRIRMRPVTNRGLRRRRPPRTRATVTRIVSSPFPSLLTDTGGPYMSLSTWPLPFLRPCGVDAPRGPLLDPSSFEKGKPASESSGPRPGGHPRRTFPERCVRCRGESLSNIDTSLGPASRRGGRRLRLATG